ncbi:MAG: TetR/AcrR family transcriptional regulator [Pseudomonadota bacterium]
MARPKATPEQREQVRRSIQSAASDIYRAGGIGAISARAVATEAGVSVGTIYSYFGDLTGLMRSLWTGRVAVQEDQFRALAAAHADPLGRIKALSTAYLEFGIEQSDLYRNVLLFVRPGDLDQPDKEALTGFAFPTLLLAAIQDGQANGQVMAGDAEDLVQMLWSTLHGALALPVNMERLDLKPAQALVALTVDGVMRMIRT